MILVQFTVKDFKSVRDSGVVKTDDVTCLVGKNEAGKTTLLQALYRLNPIIPKHGNFDVTDDYPRSDVEEYELAIDNGDKKPTVVVEATFELTKEELKDAELEFGAGLFTSDKVTFSKDYENKTFASVSVDESIAVKTILDRADLPDELSGTFDGFDQITTLSDALDEKATEMQQAFAAAKAKATAIQDEQKKAQALTEAKAVDEPSELSILRGAVAKINEKGLSLYVWDNYLNNHLPKFFYFDEFFQMTGSVNVDSLKERQKADDLNDSDLPMLGFIELARLNLDRLLKPKNTQDLINKLEGASNYLSNTILEFWSQNKHLQLRFDLRPAQLGDPKGMTEGTNLWAYVYDSVHQATTLLGVRSRGFVWFFSFLAYFSQHQKKEEKLILLLDEPGLFLHASAQGDLLRFVDEKLKPYHQVIYSTHSPFMVDANRFERVRIVEDKSLESDKTLPLEQRGTKIITDVLEASAGSLFPLQHALGYDIAQTLFIGPNCLIVEGVSDLLFLQVISGLLDSKGKTVLDSRWTITPVGGADKVPTFASLISSQKKLKVATLIDIQNKDQQQIDNLFKSKILKKNHVLTFADFTGTNEADIEDMFSADFYLRLVNEEYNVAQPVALANLPQGGPRILLRIESYLEQNPLGGNAKFNHYRPARYLAEQINNLQADIDDATLDRFENAFGALNAIL